jgi:hypothetical protein
MIYKYSIRQLFVDSTLYKNIIYKIVFSSLLLPLQGERFVGCHFNRATPYAIGWRTFSPNIKTAH